MNLTLTLASSGDVLDTVEVAEDGATSYDTGKAESVIRQIRQVTGNEWMEAARDWSNGYLVLRESGLTAAAAAFRFDPGQPRDSEGRWSETPGGGSSALADWRSQSGDISGIDEAELLSVGADVGAIMRRDGSSMADPLALYDATVEATKGKDMTPRQFITALDSKYGGTTGARIEDALRAREEGGETPAPRVAEVAPAVETPPPTPAPEPEPEVAPEYSPDFAASYEQRQERLQEGIDSGPADGDRLSGGEVASTYGYTWNDGSRAVLKEAKRDVRGMSPKAQTDAEELAGLVAEVVGVRAPVSQRVSDTEIYMEYMPGETGMKRFGADLPYSLTTSEEGRNMGLFDQIIANGDRHTGNWTVDRDNRLYAIDHGLAFGTNTTPEAYGPFAVDLLYGNQEIPRSRLLDIRQGLKGLRGKFEELGRGDWHEQMMQRMEAIESRIGGAG